MPAADSFNDLLRKATRVEENFDWSEDTVDYALFKQTLKFFARRRAKIRQLLKESPDRRLPDAVVQQILATDAGAAVTDKKPDPLLPPAFLSEARDRPIPQNLNIQTDYVLFADVDAFDEEDSDKSNSGAEESVVGKSPRRKTRRAILRLLSNLERTQLSQLLALELTKAQTFYATQWQRLSRIMDDKDMHNHQLAEEILELIDYCVITVVTIRQMLIRYDTFARAHEGIPMLNYYMKTARRQPLSAFQKMLEHEEIKMIADSYAQALQGSPVINPFNAQRLMFQDILKRSESTESTFSTGITEPFLHTLRKWYLLGGFEDRLGLLQEPSYLLPPEGGLTHEMEVLVDWRSKKTEILRQVDPPKKLSGMQTYHLTLNLLSAFLYCMNYYIVEPSSTMYVNRLGAHDAMSGTLIGMLPLGAFLSSLPYSIWTNHSYRHPFIMSCFLQIFGNLLYSFADMKGQVWIALAGRFICGLGAPKCIIRRYMADTTPMSLRTSVNAGFGMVVAAGSAMGPAMAVLLSMIEYTVAIPHIGIIYLNTLTMPGYFMAILWTTLSVIALATFEEPDREGLKEQKELESAVAIPCSPSSTVNSIGGKDENTIYSDEGEYETTYDHITSNSASFKSKWQAISRETRRFLDLITFPVRICLGLLLAKVFTIEALVSATSTLSKNRYGWKVQQVGTLGFTNGMLVIPFSILIGRLSMSYQDRSLMRLLVCLGCLGLFLLIDISDLKDDSTVGYNEGNRLAVSPHRFIAGYFIAYLSIQAFEGVIGSTLSKVIPTALASGTVNSGLLATLVDTSGRACGDMFISAMGFINLRELINLLFIPTFFIMLICLFVIERYRDLLSV